MPNQLCVYLKQADATRRSSVLFGISKLKEMAQKSSRRPNDESSHMDPWRSGGPVGLCCPNIFVQTHYNITIHLSPTYHLYLYYSKYIYIYIIPKYTDHIYIYSYIHILYRMHIHIFIQRTQWSCWILFVFRSRLVGPSLQGIVCILDRPVASHSWRINAGSSDLVTTWEYAP